MKQLNILYKITNLRQENQTPNSKRQDAETFHCCFFLFFVFNFDSLRAWLNSHYKEWSYKKKKHDEIKAYRIFLQKEPTISRCLLILDLKPFRS